MARLSHLPQAVASVLMSLQDDSSLSLSGRGLLDTTRLAGSDPKLWAGILTDNADHVSAELRRMTRSFADLANAIENRDSRAVARMISAGRKKRAVLLRSR
jgi:prephenate dehydrogenase